MISQQGRDAKLLERFRAGEPPQQIAEDAGISRQRFYVVVKRAARAAGVGNLGLSRLRRKGKRPGLTIQEAAERAGLRQAFVEALCREGKLASIEHEGKLLVAPSELRTLRRWLASDEAARRLGMGKQSLKQLCWKGRVPHAVLVGQWHFPPEAIRFVRRFPREHGLAGQRVAAQMMREAAKLDPQCRIRQKRYRQMHGCQKHS